MNLTVDKSSLIPSDEEISRILGGVHVVSWYPEDFPHFDRVVAGDVTDAQIKERLGAFNDFMSDKGLPVWPESTAIYAVRDLGAYYNYGRRDNGNIVTHYIQRPNPKFSAASRLSLATNIPMSCIVDEPYPQVDFNAMSIWHEAGHGQEASRYNFPRPSLQSEFYADCFGLDTYLQKGGDLEKVQTYLEFRAFSDLMGQPSKYWMVSTLSERFKNSALLVNEQESTRLLTDSQCERSINTQWEVNARASAIYRGIEHAMGMKPDEFLHAVQVYRSDDEQSDLYKKYAIVLTLTDPQPKRGGFNKFDHSYNPKKLKAIFGAVHEVANDNRLLDDVRNVARLACQGAEKFLRPECLPSA